MAPKARQWEQMSESDSEGESSSGNGSSAGSHQSGTSSEGEEEESRPTFAQFQGESDLEDDEDSEEEEDESEGDASSRDDEEADSDDDGRQTEAHLRKQMASVPFGALVKARSKMGARDDDFGELSEEDEWAEDRARAAAAAAKKSRSRPAADEDRRKQIKEQLAAQRGRRSTGGDEDGETSGSARREHRNLAHRTNKHAPAEMSSRRPVSRKRSVVEAAGPSSSSLRDPRFSNLSGPSVNAGLFEKNYGFVNEARSQELSTLKQTLSKLRKLEANHAGPKATSDEALKIREERAQVEQALKRQEAKEAERSRRQRESEVMRRFKHENEERVKQGGKRFYLKDSAKREMMLQDKFSRLASGKKGTAAPAEGGTAPASSSSKALRKALDKRRKKNAAKERKALPFLEAGRRGAGQEDGGERRRDGPPPAKRKRGVRGGGSK